MHKEARMRSGKKSTSSIDSNNDRRTFLRASSAAFGIAALKIGSFGISGNLLVNTSAYAYSLRQQLKDKYYDVPPGALPKLCQDPILREAFVYLINHGHDLDATKSVLFGLGRTSGSIHINSESVYFEPLAYVAANTHRWKSGDKIDFPRGQIQTLETNFYHNFALKKGIDAFYSHHVVKKRKGPNQEIEKWLAHNLFACAEPNPKDGMDKAEAYLAGDFNVKQELVVELGSKLKAMSWTEADKQNTNVSNKSKPLGPLNNWYRLVTIPRLIRRGFLLLRPLLVRDKSYASLHKQ
jgi:hypothetical protein